LENWYNPYATLSREIALGLVSTAMLRTVTRCPSARITTTVVLASTERSTKSAPDEIQELQTRHLTNVLLTTLLRVVFLPLAIAFIVATFVLFPVTERVCHAKDLQIMTGISSVDYWLSNYVFDFFVYLAAWVPIGLVFFVYNDDFFWNTVVTLCLAILAFSGTGIFFSYVVAHYAKTQAGAFTFVLLTYAVGGIVLLISYMALKLTNDGALRLFTRKDIFFTVAPPFSLAVSIIKTLKVDADNRECLRNRRTFIYRENLTLLQVMCAQLTSYKTHGAVTSYCCDHADEPDANWKPLSPLIFDVNGVAYEILVMALEGIVLFCILTYLDSTLSLHPCCAPKIKYTPPEQLDMDVLQERRVAIKVSESRDFAGCAMSAVDLHKLYGALHAVKGISFTVHTGGCLGLLGVNGAGKTTTFHMLTGLTPTSRGNAYMVDSTLSRNTRTWQSNIGYCLQFDGLLELMTAREYLRLIARLRSVRSEAVASLVQCFIDIVGLTEKADKRCGTYSGGNKRKLAIAAAVIGLPRLVFLDEPSAGVDVVARRRIFNALKDIMSLSGISVILTSHSMDECETSCDRIAIMVDGQFQCFGTLQHLKDKFGKGYTLTIQLSSSDKKLESEVQEAVEKLFPKIVRRDSRKGIFYFHLEEKLSWSELFAKVNVLKYKYAFEHAFVSDSTLEQIFIGFAQANKKDDDF
ncbi:unnamed protein product, partial [Ixodes hexagonus]